METYSCPHCNNQSFARPAKVGGQIGIEFTKPASGLNGSESIDYEPLYAIVCDGCGAIVKFFVKNPANQWGASTG